ncbi:hypothetical protein ASPZODRAFT_69950 [Penicilliopsis zonata CBS 506.65]|uniref:Protoporphyrinogen oxidase n=1 Tax=Penicilliopsis zonata CBS 506.65 TaxID=1073090 RepID=A0A1L9SE15_9EURO|nr:hypothetical protein ASPZODRAFT_69950 [Penicilliopsis zonata CBS 506.65]OJJ45392.1 hypothetical protein ASPZODRAFT_69950 [Penicilliopsis zonata CBS 506.65]
MRPAWSHSRALRRGRPQWLFHHTALASSTRSFTAAVVGGGITGLTAAYHLSQDRKCEKVTLFERSDSLGGWLQSERVSVADGDVVFEYGPRTLRASVPDCVPLLDLIHQLGLQDEVLTTGKNTPAATNRFIYYPDHLVRLPGRIPGAGIFNEILYNAKSLMEPLFQGSLSAVLWEHTKPIRPRTSFEDPDESITQFLSRRFSPQLADNLASAVFHGIYAGCIDRLSAEAVLGPLRALEADEKYGGIGVLRTMLKMANENKSLITLDKVLATHLIALTRPDGYLTHLRQFAKGVSVFTLTNGVGQLTDALVAALEESPKASVVTGAEVKAIGRTPGSSDLTITCAGEKPTVFNRVIATNSAPSLATQLEMGAKAGGQRPQKSIGYLKKHDYAVTVMVVNLYYDQPDLVPVNGFGYLIPRSIPYEQNPERALGVIFGSDSSAGQDTAPGTKLTVMMGGHWWDGWQDSDYPDHDSAVQMARSLLERHLGITDAPAVARSRLQKNAIPQYTVGHLERLQNLSQSLRDEFNKRLTIAGSWYGGVGVTDCVQQAYLASLLGVGSTKIAASSIPGWEGPMQRLDMEGGFATSPIRWYNGVVNR